MAKTAQMFELDNVRRFRKFWDTCNEVEKQEIAKIISPENEIEEKLSTRKLNEQADEIIDFLNQKTGHNYRKVEVHKKHIRARLKSGITKQELKAIIAKKYRDWEGTDAEQYLRPATLFNVSKCENYLGEIG